MKTSTKIAAVDLLGKSALPAEVDKKAEG